MGNLGPMESSREKSMCDIEPAQYPQFNTLFIVAKQS